MTIDIQSIPPLGVMEKDPQLCRAGRGYRSLPDAKPSHGDVGGEDCGDVRAEDCRDVRGEDHGDIEGEDAVPAPSPTNSSIPFPALSFLSLGL